MCEINDDEKEEPSLPYFKHRPALHATLPLSDENVARDCKANCNLTMIMID